MTCLIPNCTRTTRGSSRGWCRMHYRRWQRHGDPLVTLRPQLQMSPVERFWSTVEKSESCWTWTGARSADGYGRIHIRPAFIKAHRFSYELLVGPIPEGLVIDHLCRNTSCVNPDHLEPVTVAENTRRGAAAITECPQGHPYDATNTYLYKGIHRQCRACGRARKRAGS